MKKLAFCLLLLVSISASAQKWENLAQTPQMGWSTWNKFQCNINEQIIRDIADEMVSSGLRDAGYVYLNIDDCWHGGRDSLGFIFADKEKFPSGIAALADYVHSKGLKLGIYSDAGRETCGGRPGSQGHEYQDAITYASWGIDYLKYDWCMTENVNATAAYTLMRDALRDAGRPILFSMCEWGDNKPWLWAREIGHSWRTTADICCCFDCTLNYGNFTQLGVMQIVDINAPLREYAGLGHWNDPDMLEVGNGMTVNQDRAHFSLWCMMAAPLILGNDLKNMQKETKEIILNREMIAIDQDTLGVQGLRFREEEGLEFWLKPLAGGDWAMLILNRTLQPREYYLNWDCFDMTDHISGYSTDISSHTYRVRDLWQHADAGKTNKNKTITIPAQDVIVYRLQK